MTLAAKLRSYPAYKDSGVPWLGEVPEHWEVKPGRAVYGSKLVGNTGLVEKQVLSLSYGRIVIKPEEKLHGLVPESFETYQVVEPGDIIIRATDLQNDKTSLRVGQVHDRGIITAAYLCLQTRGRLTPDYGYQLLNVYDLKKILYGYGSGLRQNLDWSDFKAMPMPIPDAEEQAAIVRFVDYIDRKIRRYIRAKQRLIKLLEEQKQAIIHRAVTGQIDFRTVQPYPAYKPSGVEWLGNVPEHWEVRQLWTIAEMRVSNVDKHTKEDEMPVRLCNYVDVYKSDRISAQMDFMRATATFDEIERFRLAAGDVLITKDSETWDDIGVPALVAEPANDLISGYHLALLRPFTGLSSGGYLFRALQSKAVAYQFHVEAKGVTRYGLSHDGIKSVWLPLPPLPEQAVIVRFLEEATKGIDTAIDRAHREIELLREYRTRLIADVVTGKLDVRDAAANLPEEPDNLEEEGELDELMPDEADVTIDDEEPEADGDE